MPSVPREISNPAQYIREQVFGVETQAEWARLLRYSPIQISRYERGHPLSRKALRRIRALAAKQKKRLDDGVLAAAMGL